MKRAFVSWIVLSLSFLAYAPAALPAEPILIGDVTSMSGPFAVAGVPGRQGTILAVEEINQQGGVLGHPLKLLMRDDKSSPEEGAKAFRELVAEGALVVTGTAPSHVSAAINPLARELKVPFFTLLGYSRFLTEEAGHRYFFRLITNDRVFGHALADHLAKQPHTKYCTIGNDFAYGRDITKVLMTRLKELKPDVEVIPGCEFWVPPGTTDFTPTITAILAKRPQAVMFGGVVAVSSPAFVKQAKAFGLFNTALGIHPSLGMSANNIGLTRKDDVPDGILTGSDYPYPPIDNPANKAFFEAYRKRWNQFPFEMSMNAYTNVKLIVQAFKKAGKVDREALIDALQGMSIEHPTLGTITIRPFDHQSTAGWWIGYLVWDDTLKKPAMKDIRYERGDRYLPSKEEVEKLRTKK
jgi:branched-chain amino acid transport system substrate-binding protein